MFGHPIHDLIKRAAAAMAAAGVAVHLSLAIAQEPQAPTLPTPPADETAPQETPLAAQAAAIDDLLSGDLSLDVDARSLFELPEGDAGRTVYRLTLQYLNDPELLSQPADAEANAAAPPGADALARAEARFYLLPDEQQAELLARHEEQRQAAADIANADAALQAELDEVRARADAIENFLQGEPADLDRLDFTQSAAPLADADRRQRILSEVNPPEGAASEPPPETETPPSEAPADPDETSDEPPAETGLEQELAAEQARLDSLIGRYIALSSADYQRLLALQSTSTNELASVAEAEAQAAEAARLAEEAAAAAERAATEAARLVAQESGRLQEWRQEQARFEGQLASRGDVTSQLEEQTLRYRREVRELDELPRYAASRSSAADALYARLVEDLKSIRQRLAASLDAPRSESETALMPPDLDPGLSEAFEGADAVTALHADLIANAQRLSTADASMRASERDALYKAMLDLNDIRLMMIGELSGDLRSDIVGFGEAGIAQVGRELNQIGLIVRYSFSNAGALASEAARPIFNPTPSFIFGLIQIAILALAFRAWRSAGGSILSELQRTYATRRPATVVSAFSAAALGYIRDVRRPLEWLAFALLLRWILNDILPFPGDDLIWTITIGVLAAISLVTMADRLVRSSPLKDPWAPTRVRSLQLIAGSIAGVVLLLALTAETVGRGAIYSWILKACWLLAPIVAILLSWWWRDRIFALAEVGKGSDAILSWAVKHRTGALGHIARLLAGAVLLVRGAVEIVKSRIKDIALIREITDQRSEKLAAEQAAADEASGRYQDLSDEDYEALAPHRAPEIENPADRSPEDLDLPDLSPGKIIAVVGERGLGKSTALRDLVRDLDPANVLYIHFEGGGLRGLLSKLAASLKVEANESAVLEAIENSDLEAIAIDDFHRLFVPAIGGLADFDRFVSMARTCASSTAWAFGIGGPAMTYIGRARSDHSLFDEIAFLPRWDADQLRALIERRTNRLGIKPVFDLRNEAALSMFNSDLPPEERVKRAYFEKLEDLSKGNPAIALDIWRQSLFINRFTSQVEVRTYSGPSTDDLSSMPEATLFVLRAMMQMEVATLETLRWSTDLDAGLISEALRRLVRQEVIGEFSDGYRIKLHWYRAAERVLERRNLMVRAAA